MGAYTYGTQFRCGARESLSEGGRFKLKQERSLTVSGQIRERRWGAGDIPGRRKSKCRGSRKEQTQQVKGNERNPLNLACEGKEKDGETGRGPMSRGASETIAGFHKTGDFRAGGVCHLKQSLFFSETSLGLLCLCNECKLWTWSLDTWVQNRNLIVIRHVTLG